MALKKKPVTGMKDILPAEMAIRDYVIRLIKETYGTFGFSSIETPCVEHIENLSSKQGGENEKLIFKILKRGEKLKLDTAETEADLVDGGLRYDLTLPLSRYYSNHANELPSPFKALQMGNVWRADRPQRGRYRQFMQCDIDIIGNASPDAEVELILTTTKALTRIGLSSFKVKINDRRILKAIFTYAGFAEEDHEKLAIIFDKLDKIGIEGVQKELEENAFDASAIEKFIALFESGALDLDSVAKVCDADYVASLKYIMDTVTSVSGNAFPIEFTPSLVRGQGYYTGTIFEVEAEGYSGAVAGGGRYDNLIGKFLNEDIPAVGFSIGFERIILILLEQGFEVPGKGEKVAFLLEKNLPADRLKEAIEQAQSERACGKSVLVVRMNKNKKFQKQQLEAQGYTAFEEFYANPIR